MAISDYKNQTLTDPEAIARGLGNIAREFQTRFIGDSEAAGHAYLAILGLRASDADTRTAVEKRDRARYDELKAFNPFEAAEYGNKNPHVFAHGANTVNTALRMAQSRALAGRQAAEANFEGAAGRVLADKEAGK